MRRTARVAAIVCITGAGGCLQPPGYHRPLEPVADRLVKEYPDLASGRLHIIAHFETLDHGAIFRLSPPTAAGYVGIVTERARPETGAGSLKVSLRSRDQELIVEDSGQGGWTLLRDWRPFHLLLMSIYSPRPIGGVAFAARSGTEKPAEYRQADIVLREGWNLVRIDLGDLAERIDLADVRQLRVGCPQLAEPIDLYIDDIVLADNGRNILASPTAQPGDLFVRSEGKRLRVGVVERFELAFSRGQIVQWFDLAVDPNRLRNLAGGGPIGPVPVVLGAGAEPTTDEVCGWDRLGPSAEAFQKLVEASPVRVVIWGEWRFGPITATAPAGGNAPLHRWVYTIYATGKVCLEFAGNVAVADPASGAQRPIGYTVSCADGEGFERIIHPAGTASNADGERTGADALSYVLYRQTKPDGPDLLYAFHRGATAPLARPIRHGQEPRLGALFYGGPAESVTAWAAMLTVWPHDIDGPRQAEEMALDYANPTPIAIDAGRLVRTDTGDIDNDGFNESRGHYTLEPDGNKIKVRLDGDRRMRFGPAFKIVDVADKNVWVYVDGMIIQPVARDDEGNAIFQVPRVLDKETLVEVTTRAKNADAVPE